MVWGMNLPKGFGEFWPSGDFEGWDERLTDYYYEQPPEVQKELFDYPEGPFSAELQYPFYVSKKMICEVGTKVRLEFPLITAVLPEEAPTSFVTRKSHKKLGSLIMFNNRIIAADEELKALIERLEPDVHQFFPIEIIMPKGVVFPKKYYTLVIGQYLDSFVPEKSKADSFTESNVKPGFYKHEENKKGVNGIALSKAKFGEAHLWRERHLGGEWLTCFSDELITEIEAAGLRLPKHYQMKEV